MPKVADATSSAGRGRVKQRLNIADKLSSRAEMFTLKLVLNQYRKSGGWRARSAMQRRPGNQFKRQPRAYRLTTVPYQTFIQHFIQN